MGIIIGIGIFFIIVAIIARLSTKKGKVGDAANIIWWLWSKIWMVLIVFGIIAIVIGLLNGVFI